MIPMKVETINMNKKKYEKLMAVFECLPNTFWRHSTISVLNAILDVLKYAVQIGFLTRLVLYFAAVLRLEGDFQFLHLHLSFEPLRHFLSNQVSQFFNLALSHVELIFHAHVLDELFPDLLLFFIDQLQSHKADLIFVLV